MEDEEAERRRHNEVMERREERLERDDERREKEERREEAEEAAERRRPHRVRWALGPVSDNIHPPVASAAGAAHHHHPKGHTDMSFALKDNQQVPLSVTGSDAAGNPAALTGTPVFSVDDTSILTLTDNGDGTALVAATGAVGTGTVTVKDDETDGKSFIGSLAIDVTSGSVASVTLTPGVPVDKP